MRDPRHYPETAPTDKPATNIGGHQRGIKPGDFCALCGAWRGSLGIEPTIDLYVDHLVSVFRELRRVLRNDGTLWLNLDDSYAGSWGAQSRRDTASNDPSWHGSQIKNHPKRASHTGALRTAGVKPKDLYGVPWLVAFALRADGWYLRSEITWAKRAPMPESVTDRPTSATESVFLLSKAEHYFYDAEAVKEAAASDHPSGNGFKRPARLTYADAAGPRGSEDQWDQVGGKRNMRNFWLLGPAPFREAHFATMPPKVVEPCILAGTSERGVCPTCGSPWSRQVKHSRTRDGQPLDGSWSVNEGGVRIGATGVGHWRDQTTTQLIGWSPTCSCNAGDPIPAMVLDPFGGAGTVGLVADRLGRDSILVELNPAYAEMARRRIDADAPERRQLEGDERHSSAIGAAIEPADALPLFASAGASDDREAA